MQPNANPSTQFTCLGRYRVERECISRCHDIFSLHELTVISLSPSSFARARAVDKSNENSKSQQNTKQRATQTSHISTIATYCKQQYRNQTLSYRSNLEVLSSVSEQLKSQPHHQLPLFRSRLQLLSESELFAYHINRNLQAPLIFGRLINKGFVKTSHSIALQ